MHSRVLGGSQDYDKVINEVMWVGFSVQIRYEQRQKSASNYLGRKHCRQRATAKETTLDDVVREN